MVGLAIYAVAAWQYGYSSYNYAHAFRPDVYWREASLHEATVFILLGVSAAVCAVCSVFMLKMERKRTLYLGAMISIAAGPVVAVFAAATDYYGEAVSMVALPAAAVAAVILNLYWREYLGNNSGGPANGSAWPR